MRRLPAMPPRDTTGWMWAEACQLLEEAERLHRQFFRLGSPAGTRVAWEPPVDVYEDEDRITIVVALPGVAPEHAEVVIEEPRNLVIRAERRLPIDGNTGSIRRMEIPHGYFERRSALPMGRLEPVRREWVNGWLVMVMRKVN